MLLLLVAAAAFDFSIPPGSPDGLLVFTITLDMSMNALAPPRRTSGPRVFVDELFAFSHSLGADCTGGWADSSTFKIHTIDTASAGVLNTVWTDSSMFKIHTMSGPCVPMPVVSVDSLMHLMRNASLGVISAPACIHERLVHLLAPQRDGSPSPPNSFIFPYAPSYSEGPPPNLVYSYCDNLAFAFDKAGDKTDNVYELFSFLYPSIRCANPFNADLPVCDIANGFNSSGAWSEGEDRSIAFVLQLECPGGRVPPGTPYVAEANNYFGTQPTPYLIGKKIVTLLLLGFAPLPDYPRPTFMPYEFPGAHLKLGVDESTFVLQIIDPIDIIPSVSSLMPRSTRQSNLNVQTTGGRGLQDALIQNRLHSSNESIADKTELMAVEGDFGVVRTRRLLSCTVGDPDNADPDNAGALLSTSDSPMLRVSRLPLTEAAPRTPFTQDTACIRPFMPRSIDCSNSRARCP